MKQTKHLLPLLMAIVMMAMSPQRLWALTQDTDGYYKIGNATDLSDFRNLVNGGSNSINAKLTASFSVSSGAYTPIGTSGKQFKGTFNGQGYTITFSGATTTSDTFGLFGYVNGATIKDLKVAGTMTVSGAKSHIGGFVGELQGASKITGCTFRGTLDAGSSTDCIGGIVGYANNTFSGYITNCFCNGTLKTSGGTDRYVGGILGYFNDENTKKPTIQYNFCDALFMNGTNNMTSGTYTHGIIGRIRAHANNIKYNTSKCSGNITTAMQPNSTTDATIDDTNTAFRISVDVDSNSSTYGTTKETYVDPTSSAPTKLQVKAIATASRAHFTKWSDGGAQTHEVELTSKISLTATFTAHSYKSKTTTSTYKKSDATCTAAATYYYKCNGCDAMGTETYSSTDTKDKCKGHGNTNGYTATYGEIYPDATCKFTLKCKDCSTNVVNAQTLTTTSGTYGYFTMGTTTAAKCTTDGSQVCYVHGKFSDAIGSKVFDDSGNNTNNTKTYPIPAIGHGNTKGYSATYTWSGTYDAPVCKFTLTCKDCSTNVVSAQNLTTTSATYGSYTKGTQTDPKCTVLGSLPCTANGKYTDATSKKSYTESGSGVNLTHSYDIPMLNHDWNDVVEHVAPTCIADGNEAYYTCKRECCAGKNYKDNGEHTTDVWDNIVIAKLNHDWNDVVAHVNPTCTTDGHEQYYTCKRTCCAGKNYKDNTDYTTSTWDNVVIEKLNHNWTDLVCSRCDAATGEGTEAAPYLITTSGQLSWFSDGINNRSLSAASNARLLADIHAETPWTPISNSQDIAYSGVFDGNHKTIHLHSNNDGVEYMGLFEIINGATVKDLTVEGDIRATVRGGLIAALSFGGEFINCITDGSVSVSGNNDAKIGGIIGLIYGSTTLTNCANHANIYGTSEEIGWDEESGYSYKYHGRIGGLVGTAVAKAEINNCYNYGCTQSGYDNGAIIGAMNDQNPATTHNVAYIEGFDGTELSLDITAYGEGGGDDNVQRFSVADFRSGKVAHYLNAGSTSDVAWHQTLGTDNYPVLDATHGTVYYGYVNCTEHGYSNVAVNETRGKHPSTAFDDATDPDHTLCNLCNHSILRYTANGDDAVSPNNANNFTDAKGNRLGIVGNTYDSTTKQGEMEFDGVLDVVGASAFSNRQSLTSVIIPISVTGIGSYAFNYCTYLTSVTIPNSVTSIADCAFNYCLNLTTLSIPGSVSIGESAFAKCHSLPADEHGVIYAGTYLVKATNNDISSYNIRQGTRYIGSCSFSGRTNLAEISIPESVERIEEDAFSYCSALATITVAPENTVYDSRNGSNAICETATNTLIAGCKNTTIPNSITSIGSYAFFGCTGLTGITIPNSVTSIGSDAFNGCTALTGITIPKSVTQIGWRAFQNCNKLTDITFKSIPWVRSAFSESTSCTLALSDDSYVYTGKSASAFPTLAKTATYTRQMSNQWGTLVLPFDIDIDDDAPYNFYQVSGMQGGSLGISRLTGTLEAGTPVLVYSHKDGKNDETGMYDLTLTATDCGISTTIPEPEAAGGVTVKSTYADLTLTNADADNYFIYNGAFYSTSLLKDGQKLTINPFHAYLEAATTSEAKLQIVVQDETTTIHDSQFMMHNEPGAVYNLQGQKLQAPQKGVNIINGKKVMVK